MAKEDPTDKLLDDLLAGKNPEAIETVYPRAQVQLCIIHLIRH